MVPKFSPKDQGQLVHCPVLAILICIGVFNSPLQFDEILVGQYWSHWALYWFVLLLCLFSYNKSMSILTIDEWSIYYKVFDWSLKFDAGLADMQMSSECRENYKKVSDGFCINFIQNVLEKFSNSQFYGAAELYVWIHSFILMSHWLLHYKNESQTLFFGWLVNFGSVRPRHAQILWIHQWVVANTNNKTVWHS